MPRVLNPVLTEKERAEADTICCETQDVDDFMSLPVEVRTAILHRMGRLTEALLKRRAIPDIRFAYLTERIRNPGVRAKSVTEVFESNGTSGPAIFRHGDFPPHFRYLIDGPNLPQPVIDEFSEIADREGISEVTAYVRKAVREHGLDPRDAGDQFYQLAYEIGHSQIASAARKAARGVPQ